MIVDELHFLPHSSRRYRLAKLFNCQGLLSNWLINYSAESVSVFVEQPINLEGIDRTQTLIARFLSHSSLFINLGNGEQLHLINSRAYSDASIDLYRRHSFLLRVTDQLGSSHCFQCLCKKLG